MQKYRINCVFTGLNTYFTDEILFAIFGNFQSFFELKKSIFTLSKQQFHYS